jgi:hypothetical protein
MTVVGLVGYPNTGKDTLAAELCDKYGYQRFAFGDAVKELLLELDPHYQKSLWVLERNKRDNSFHTREKLQNLGQFMREVDKDYWINKLNNAGVPMNAVFTDIRYENELAFVRRNFGGVIFGVSRTGSGPVNDHASERNTTELLKYVDYTIENEGTPSEAADDIRTKLDYHLRHRDDSST